MSEIPMQFELPNNSTGTIMTDGKIIIEQLRNIHTPSTETLKERLKQ